MKEFSTRSIPKNRRSRLLKVMPLHSPFSFKYKNCIIHLVPSILGERHGLGINSFIAFLVRSFGTEDRPTDRPVAPRDEVYEYIIFRGSDIKDIRVCQPPKPQPTLEGGLPNDPAIVQVLLSF
jgi:hypothetical protein